MEAEYPRCHRTGRIRAILWALALGLPLYGSFVAGVLACAKLVYYEPGIAPLGA